MLRLLRCVAHGLPCARRTCATRRRADSSSIYLGARLTRPKPALATGAACGMRASPCAPASTMPRRFIMPNIGRRHRRRSIHHFAEDHVCERIATLAIGGGRRVARQFLITRKRRRRSSTIGATSARENRLLTAGLLIFAGLVKMAGIHLEIMISATCRPVAQKSMPAPVNGHSRPWQPHIGRQ